MSLEIEAVYEDGILKPNQQLPLQNGQRVKLTVHKSSGRAKASAGVFPWQGDRDDLQKLLGPDNHPWNSDA
jgi:predicted DNA-binding antitoxin AbrB/MazE fold protein